MSNLLYIGNDVTKRTCQLCALSVPFSKLTLKGVEEVYSVEFLTEYLPTIETLSTKVLVVDLGILSNVGLESPVVVDDGNEYVAKIAVLVFYLGGNFIIKPIPYLKALTFDTLRYISNIMQTDFGKYLTLDAEKTYGSVIEFLSYVASKEYPNKPNLFFRKGYLND